MNGISSNICGVCGSQNLVGAGHQSREENVDGYKIDYAREQDAFPDPKWPTQSLGELIEKTFAGRMIDNAEHPALLRLIGAKQVLG